MTIYLSVDGSRVTPETSAQGHLTFRLRLPSHEIRLISGHAIPADTPGLTDDRVLGVALQRLRWQQGNSIIDTAIQSPGFVDGFHNLECYDPEQGPFRWTNGNAGLPPTLFPPWHGETLLHLRLFWWDGSHVQRPPPPEAVILGAFESIGENCELGVAQQHYGVVLPLTMLRWAGTSFERLMHGLENRFAGLGDPATTEVAWEPEDYRLRTPYFGLHTGVRQQRDAAGVTDVLETGCATLRLLRRKLLRDIAYGRRVFVFTCADPAFGKPEMFRLHEALRAIGPASLLCVTLRQPTRADPMAERLADGLYAGYLNRFTIQEGPYDEWLALCSTVLALHHAG